MSVESYVGVRIQGGLLPADLLSKLTQPRTTDLPGLTSRDYHLAAGESVRDAANRIWPYLRTVWAGFRDALDKLPESDTATSLTRERFLLVLIDQLGFGRIPLTPKGGLTVEGDSFPISHLWHNVPIHLLGARVSLDTRTKGVPGAAGASPQSMLQDALNRSDDHLWAVLANGTQLRLLRDSTSLVGQAYVEFDLEAIFDGDLFADFLLLFTLCHVSRLEVRDPEIGPASCWLEEWRHRAIENGSRAMDLLRDGVVDALRTLGTGFLTQPANVDLRAQLSAGTIGKDDLNHALLRVVYRLMFTFVAEDRGVLLDPSAPAIAKQRYLDYFSTARLRRTSQRRIGDRHIDRWRGIAIVWRSLGAEQGSPELGLPGLGGIFEAGELDLLLDCELSNEVLLGAVRALSVYQESGSKLQRVVDYRNLGAEELGSIYESLLEYVPSINTSASTFHLDITAGNDRKDTGSYYTPTSLVESLLDTALNPVLDTAEKSDDPETALLDITVCDPACGSGHFLVGAARRIAKRVAAVRVGDPEPAPAEIRSAMRDVVSRCIYGVDINPLAAELAKVSLWLKAMEPGRPMAFLDAQIKVSNALFGAAPRSLSLGLPDGAFRPLEGDDPEFVSTLKEKNKIEREYNRQDSLFSTSNDALNETAPDQIKEVIAMRPSNLSDVHVQQQRLRSYTDSTEYRNQRLLADTWCSAFVWPKYVGAPNPPTQSTLEHISAGTAEIRPEQALELERLTAKYRFFHWHLEFPHILKEGTNKGRGGFTTIIGNPPWGKLEVNEWKFFESQDPGISDTPEADRPRVISEIIESQPRAAEKYEEERRYYSGTRSFLASSGQYPLCGLGRFKTDPVFAELGLSILHRDGHFGMLLPTGIATDDTYKKFFAHLVENKSLSSLIDFENAKKAFFKTVDSRFRFCLLSLVGRGKTVPLAELAFGLHDVREIYEPGRRYTLEPNEIMLLNPNTGTCPVFSSRQDADITLKIYRNAQPLLRRKPRSANPWGITLKQGIYNITADKKLFRTREQLLKDSWVPIKNQFHKDDSVMLPVHEGKMGSAFDYRFASFYGIGKDDLRACDSHDATAVAMPRYWVSSAVNSTRLARLAWGTDASMLGFRRVARNTDERTCIASLLPMGPASYGWILSAGPNAQEQAILCAMFNSFVLDFALRQFLTQPSIPISTFEQVPLVTKETISSSQIVANNNLGEWIAARSGLLSATGEEMQVFADELGITAQPWNIGDRLRVRSELDAAFFHLYGLSHADAEYILNAFPIVKRKDLRDFGEYRTKDMILDVYDSMAEAQRKGVHYKSPLDDLIRSVTEVTE